MTSLYLTAYFIISITKLLTGLNMTTKVSQVRVSEIDPCMVETNDYAKAELCFFKNKTPIPDTIEFVLNPAETLCTKSKGEHIDVLFCVLSAPSYFKRRLLIRESWVDVLSFLTSELCS